MTLADRRHPTDPFAGVSGAGGFSFPGARLTASLPTAPPTSVAAGESYQWRWDFGDYVPADGYSLKLYLRGPDAFDVTATSDLGYWLVTLAAASTTDVPAGDYTWTAYTEKGTDDTLERWHYATGTLTVTPNLVTAASRQTHAAKTLAVLEAALEGRLSADLESYSIGGRSVTKIPVAELVRLRNQYAAAVFNERHGAFGRRIEVSFG